MYALLSKVKEAKRTCIQQGSHHPTKEEIALCAGMTVEKLDKLLFTARMPLSMQQPVWSDQDTTFQVAFLLIFYLEKLLSLNFKYEISKEVKDLAS